MEPETAVAGTIDPSKFCRLKPRNTLVTVRRHRQKEKKIGAIIMPEGFGQFETAEIIEVGPGNPADSGSGGRCDNTADLKPGQTVLIRASKRVSGPTGQAGTAKTSLPFEINGDDIDILDQTEILGILE